MYWTNPNAVFPSHTPVFQTHNNETSYLLTSLAVASNKYCVAVSSSIDSHLTSGSSSSKVSVSCFSNCSIMPCDEAPTQVTVFLPEQTGDLYYVEVIGVPLAGLVFIVLVLVISWKICRHRSRLQRHRGLIGEVCI